MSYAVKEIFLTLQGEGAHAGRASVFCRFSGCNLWNGREQDRATRSIRDHMTIIEALEQRQTERAEDLVRNHALGLAEHVSKYAGYLD